MIQKHPWQPPYYFRKKKSQESKTEDFIFVLGLKKIGTFLPKFLFPGFFSNNFFLVIFFTENRTLYTALFVVHCVYCTASVQCHLYIVYCTYYSVHCIVFIVKYNSSCLLYNEPYTTVICILYTVQCILYIVCCTVYTVYCILYSVYCILYTVQCTLHCIYCKA